MKEVLNNIRIRDRKDIEVVDDANYTVGKKCKFPLHFILFPLALFIREFGIRKGLKKLVISSKIRIFIGENQ